MENFPGWTVQFELLFRQEQSRHASGRTRVKDFGTPIWMATYQSVPLRPNALDEWRARLAALGNGLGTFKAWPTSRCWPQAHPRGVGAVNGTIASIGADNKSIVITWDGGGTTVLTVGDYVELNGQRLYQITDRLPGGVNMLVPHLSVGTLVGQTVNIDKPGVLMSIVPGSVSTTAALNGRGTVTFQAIESRG